MFGNVLTSINTNISISEKRKTKWFQNSRLESNLVKKQKSNVCAELLVSSDNVSELNCCYKILNSQLKRGVKY